MKRLLIPILLIFISISAHATTWYVNSSTGGTRYSAANTSGQCSGKSNAPYVKGVNQPCAFNDARLLWNDPYAYQNATWVLAPGDTAILETGGQISGSQDASAIGKFCFGTGTYCVPPDLPSGTSGAHTRLLGANYASCSISKTFIGASAPTLAGDPSKQTYLFASTPSGQAPFYAISLATSQFVDVECLDISGQGGRSGQGIYSGSATTPTNGDILLQDLTVEGFADSGLRGNFGGLWTLTRDTFQFNAQAGINNDPGNGQQSTGSIVASYVSIFANGCLQEFPVVHAFSASFCRDQNNAGYGDGWGGPPTALPASCDHCLTAYNTQDGIDWGHTNNSDLSITNSQMYGNMGGNLKAGPSNKATFTNNIINANCQRMHDQIADAPSGWNAGLTLWCRASDQNSMAALTTATLNTNGRITSVGTAVTGVATSFTSQYTVGQIIMPGDASNVFSYPAYARVITSIASDTSLTVESVFPTNISNPMYVVTIPPGGPSSNTTLTIVGNSLVGYGATTLDVSCQTGYPQIAVDNGLCAGLTYTLKNNILLGFSNPNYNENQAPGAFYNITPTADDYNVFYGFRGSYSKGKNDIKTSPLFVNQHIQAVTVEADLDNFNFNLTTSSPAKWSGITISGLAADFNGFGRHSPSSMGALEYGSVPFSLAAPLVALSIPSNPVASQQSGTLIASVTSTNQPVPSGTVTFSIAGSTIGSGTLDSSGNATYVTASLASGSYSVNVNYSGDSNYAAGISNTVSLTVTAAPSIASSTALTVAPNPVTVGQTATLSANVTTVGGVAPTGTIIFLQGGISLGVGALVAGVATITNSSLLAGTYSIRASYGGDTNYIAGASAAVSLSVNAVPTTSTTSLTVNPSPVTVGSITTLSVAVKTVAGVVPTGSITFSVGRNTLSTTALNSAGVATITNSSFAAGTYSLIAAYGGDSKYTSGTSNTVSLTVNPAASAVAVTVGQPEFGFNLIPGATRRLFATVANGVTNQVLWTVKSGAATLSATSGEWVDVVASPTGAACSYTNTGGVYGVRSSTKFTIEAVSVDDSTKKSDVIFNVCNPTLNVAVVPFYRTLYANQSADMQSIVTGSVNQNVQWAVSSQPIGGDGKLGDTTSRDTVFSASVAGRYTLTSTSQADSTKSTNAIIYVTGHAIPYTNPVTPNFTSPVDCSVDPFMYGTVYEVGPSQAFHTLASVPFPTMPAGSTVRVHNEDTTGLHPTEFHEYVQILQQATASQPTRLCGVPDSLGNLPIIDGSNATGRTDVTSGIAGLGLLTIHKDASTKAWPFFTSPGYLVVEGIHFRNAKTGYSYVTSSGSTSSWSDTSACVRINEGQNINIVGNDLDNCGTGAMSAWNANIGWAASDLAVLWEGNHLHNNGISGSSAAHQMDLQAWGEVVQFNRIENPTTGSRGANLKSRGLQNIIRYNYLGDGPARQMDLVDVTAAAPYMSFSGFLDGGSTSYHAMNPADTYPADQLAAEQEAWNLHYVYGNIYQNSVSMAPIHVGMDTAGGEMSRKGSVYWYNNTFYQKSCSACGALWTLFDTTAGKGTFLPQTEFPTVQTYNNVVWMDDATSPAFQWNNYSAFIGIAGKNLLPTNWGTNNTTGGTGSGWNILASTDAYQGSTNLAAHVTGFTSSNLITVSAMPFDPTSWVLNSDVAGSALVPIGVCEMPARFAYLPNLGYAVARISTPNVGATDTSSEMGTQMTSIRGVSRFNTHYSNCR
jgi:hypothetical protein